MVLFCLSYWKELQISDDARGRRREGGPKGSLEQLGKEMENEVVGDHRSQQGKGLREQIHELWDLCGGVNPGESRPTAWGDGCAMRNFRRRSPVLRRGVSRGRGNGVKEKGQRRVLASLGNKKVTTCFLNGEKNNGP